MSRFAACLATAGYVGYIPIAPGTFGSAVGLAVYAAVRWSDSIIAEVVVLLVVMVMGLWAADVVEKKLGKDPGVVVIDEVLGMLVTLAFINASVSAAVAGFFLFRLFDVIKPYPAGHLEHLRGGPGIMLDDAMAGVYANLALRGLIALFPAALA